MKLVLLLALLTVGESYSRKVFGRTGENVTLSCHYDIKKHGSIDVCWNQGELPLSGCNNQLIATDGYKVIEGTRVSSRYQLLGRLDQGDVSLTILDLTETDAGRYGCKVSIPGWLNDEKHHIDLTVYSVGESYSRKVVGRTGENVTLSCHYDIKEHGSIEVCWNQGELPLSGCNNQLIATDGYKVIEGTRVSSRYQLLGRLDQGDVSLMMLDLTETDAGRYGCKVSIPGWFNDEKHYVDLAVYPGPQETTPAPTNTQIKWTQQEMADQTWGYITDRRGSDVSSITEPAVVLNEGNCLYFFHGNTVRVSFVILIPALILAAVYMRRRTGG